MTMTQTSKQFIERYRF